MNPAPTRKSIWTTALLLATSAVLSTGCVSQGSHDELLSINRQLEERVSTLEQQIAALEQTIRDKDNYIAAMSDQSSANTLLRQRLAEEQQNVANLREQLAALRAELDAASGSGEIIVVQGLPQEVSDALRDLAAANPDLMTYDANRGMIRLRSDLTFGLGSAEVNEAASAALARLAAVLNSPAAREFDIQVVGHTDAVPVTSAAGRQLHIDNRGLSSNRGDAVARVLIRNGITDARVMSGGRGATQPVEPNDNRGRSQANRRVEIFLVRASESTGAAAPAPAPQPGGGGVTEGAAEPQGNEAFK